MGEPEPTGPERLAAGVIGMYEQLRAVLHPAELARAAAARTGELEAIESDLADFTRPFLDAIADHPDTDPRLADALRTITAPHHQSQLVIVAAAAYALIRQLVDAAMAPYATEVQNKSFAAFPSVPLSPAELATAVVKAKLTQDQASPIARKSGLDADPFNTLVEITGEPIAIEQALLLYRRGQIDDACLKQIVAESRIKPNYITQIKDLRYAPPPAGEVVAGRLKNHLTDAEYAQKLSYAGINPDEGAWMLAAAGRPYGPGEALDLWNRGEIDEAAVDQVIAQSDMNPSFGPDFKKLRRYLPPPRSVVPLLRSGAITEDYARQLLEMHGLTQTDADAFVAEATMTKTSPVKQLSAQQTLKMYESRLIDQNETRTRLAGLKYPADEIDLLITAADDARHLAYVDAVIARVHARYVANKLSKNEATSTLLADGVPTAAVTDYLTLWDLERGANYHALTPSQVVGAYRRGEILPPEVKERLLALGVQPADMKIVLADGWPPTKPPTPAMIDAVLNA